MGRKNVKQYLDDVERYATRDDDRRLMRQLKTLVEESLGYKLFSVIESTKRELSQKEESLISFHESDIAIDQNVSRGKFESDSDDVVGKILGSLDATIKQSGLTFKQIDIVCCTGGTAKIPALARSSVTSRCS